VTEPWAGGPAVVVRDRRDIGGNNDAGVAISLPAGRRTSDGQTEENCRTGAAGGRRRQRRRFSGGCWRKMTCAGRGGAALAWRKTSRRQAL